jgi:chemosensory pili system protein ChpA (sensor histidine kinase/response regulator)
MIELFLAEASEHLQFLREYSGILQDPYPLYEDIERLYISAHGVAGTGGTYGYALFQEVAGKLAHIFQYAMNATISPEATTPLVEFIYEAIAVLESDLIMVGANGAESLEDIAAFKKRYPFAFQGPPPVGIDAPTEQPHPPRPEPEAEPVVTAAVPVPPVAAPAPPETAQSPAAKAAQSAAPVALAPAAPSVASSEAASGTSALEQPAEPAASVLLLPVAAPDVIAPTAPVATESAAPAPAVSVPEAPVEVVTPAVAAPPTAPVQPIVAAPPVVAAPPAVAVQPIVTAPAKPPAVAKISIDSIPELELDDKVPPEVLEFFVPEVEEHLQGITDCLLALEAKPNAEDINRLFRAIHTIKGSAAQVGWQRIATIAHRAEDLIGRLRDGELKPSATIIDLCLETVDVIRKQIYRQWESEASFQSAARTLIARLENASSAESAAADTATAEDADTVAVAAPLAADDRATTAEVESPLLPLAAPSIPVGMAQSKSVRIALERLDRMMNAVGELVINRTRMLGRLAELEKLAEVLNFSKSRMSDKVLEFQDKYEFSHINSLPLLSSWPGESAQMQHPGGYGSAAGSGGSGGARFGTSSFGGGGYEIEGYGSVGHPEFSELEMDRYDDFGILSRSLTEISADITEVLTQLDGFVRRVDGDIDEFTKLAHRMQDEITQARMVPIGNLFTRIARTVRDAAKATGKQVELTLAGAETELDNNIIQQIADPLLHLVRNAVAHGIERVDERYEAGKPDQGNIAVRAYHKGNHIYVEVEDDGRGVDFDRVKATAVESGVLAADKAESLSRREVLDLLFRPGFSTAPRRTELAGRGVGLDVVRSNVANLNGEIEIETEKGIGSRFTLKVPLTLIISQALFVQCGEQTFAFPLGFVEEVRRIRTNEIEEVGGKLITKVRDVLTEVVRFDEALQLPRLEPVNGYLRLVLVNVGGRQVGVVVEEVLRKDEIVIKNLGEYLRSVKLFPGATIAPDGSLILLVDVNRLIMGESIERRPLTTAMNAARLFLPGAAAVARGEIPAAAVDAVEREKLVVLADDSISVRKFVGRMLEKAGYRVKLASDGLEALEIATTSNCDLVITDLEMPRTNGYELMLHLRQTPATSKVPVMVVTSRAGAKHRDRALKEGAAAFMVKPVQEESFIAQVVELIGSSGQKTAAPPMVQ